jgi:hypothetical protein
MASMITKVKKLNPATTAVLVCDIQERFRDVIMGFESLVKCSGFVVKSAGELGMPVVVTEPAATSSRRRSSPCAPTRSRRT